LKDKKKLRKESHAEVQQSKCMYAQEMQRRNDWDEKYRQSQGVLRRRLSELDTEIEGIKLRRKEEAGLWKEAVCKIRSCRDKPRKKAGRQQHQAIRDLHNYLRRVKLTMDSGKTS
jgi:hypothetical protein